MSTSSRLWVICPLTLVSLISAPPLPHRLLANSSHVGLLAVHGTEPAWPWLRPCLLLFLWPEKLLLCKAALSVFSSLYSNANSQRELDQLFKIYIILLILFSCFVFLSLKLVTNIQNILLSELFCFPCHNVKDIQRTSWEEYCSVLLSAHLFVPGRVPMSCKWSIENQRFCASYKASPAVWLG